MNSLNFTFAASPELHFGAGKIKILPSLVKRYGRKILLITGASSFRNSTHYSILINSMKDHEVDIEEFMVAQEPSPELVDECVQQYGQANIDLVVAIGGGSVMDGAKAISAMLPLREPCKEYLEGVGSKIHLGLKIPLIAIPTTAGTGSEATKNAVLSQVGPHGFKKSLRHQNFVPNVALLDPELMLQCPPLVTAYSGMDAFTQLLESYLATTSNPITDALALKGLELVRQSLCKAYEDGSNIEARGQMSLAAMLSGITLANAGLGLVHGIAGALGGYHEIPHGVICSRLMQSANIVTVQRLRQDQNGQLALRKYAQVGRLFSDQPQKSDHYYIDSLLDLIGEWTALLQIPSLSSFGLQVSDLPKIVSSSDYKNNPVAISKEEMLEVLEKSI